MGNSTIYKSIKTGFIVVISTLVFNCGGGSSQESSQDVTSDSDNFIKTASAVNAQITVNAGISQVSDPNLLVPLSGRATTQTEGSLRYQWTQISGPTAFILNPFEPTTSVLVPNISEATVLHFQLSATLLKTNGENALTNSDTMSIIINPFDAALRAIGGAVSESEDQVIFSVSLSKPAETPIVLEYFTEDQTALAGIDYEAASGSLTFQVGEQDKTVPVSLFNNAIEDGDKHFLLRLEPINSDTAATRAFAAVIDDETPGQRRISPPPEILDAPGLAQEPLEGQDGIVRVNLAWEDDINDIDIIVTDPCGNEISFGTRIQDCQGFSGRLEADNGDAGVTVAAENVFWGDDAPTGEYIVSVSHFAGNPTEYRLNLFWGNESVLLAGELTHGERLEVFRFFFDDQVPNPDLLAPSLVAEDASRVLPLNSPINAIQIQNMGGAELTDCSSEDLPAGLSVNVTEDATTCEIIGIPTNAQEATEHTITATNSMGSASTTISIVIENFVTVSGAVKNYFTGEDIPNAIIAIANEQVLIEIGSSDINGEYTLDFPESLSTRYTVSAVADGFIEQTVVVQSLPFDTELNNPTNILLLPTQSSQIIEPSVENTLSVEDFLIATIPSNTLRREDAADIVGNITAKATIIDPSSDPAVMPGEYLTLTNDGSLSHIQTFGAVSISVCDDTGTALQIIDNAAITLNIPLANIISINNAPSSVPLYYFDSMSGLWVEQGTATLSEISAGLWAYVAQVPQLGIWSSGVQYDAVNITGSVESFGGERLIGAKVIGQGQNYIGSSTTYTDDQGNFSLAAKASSQVLINAQHLGSSNTRSIVTTNLDTSLSTPLIIGEAAASITLTWGESPRDLDSHLFGPNGNNGEFHIYYANRDETINDVLINLDVDDTNGFGPEVITIPNVTLPGVYRYIVHNFSGSPDISIPARVELNLGGELFVYSPPESEPVMRYWAVFNLEVDENLNVSLIEVQNWVENTNPPNVSEFEAQAARDFSGPYQKLINSKFYSK